MEDEVRSWVICLGWSWEGQSVPEKVGVVDDCGCRWCGGLCVRVSWCGREEVVASV